MATEDVFGIVGTTQAGNFHVEEAVAQGGFGVVYRAQHGGFRAPVALKCLKVPADLNQRQRDVFLEKFREEAEILFRLSAAIPEVVRPLHVDVLDQQGGGGFVPFLAMEWLAGESLEAIIQKRASQGLPPLGLHKLIKMLRPAIHALGRAHRFPGPQGTESIVHRDLKPENLFIATIGGEESVKILDFGIAKARRVASEAAGRITGQPTEEDESASFTPAYGAPEQWAPKRFGATGPWTDVWGMALTMVEALIGGPAIDGDTYAMRRMALDPRRRPTPRTLGATVADAVEEVFGRAMAVDPRERIRDIEVFWVDLERAAGLSPSFGPRDPRREAGAAPSSEEIVVSSGARASTSTSRPGSSPKLSPGNVARAERMAPPPSGPQSSDFSDVFAPSERAPVPAGESGRWRALESREIDLGEGGAVSSKRPFTMGSDLELSLPVDSSRGSNPRLSPRPPAPQTGELELSPMPPRPGSAPVLPRPAPHGGNLPTPPRSEESAAMQRLSARIRGPLFVLLLAIAISATEIAYTRITGTPLMLGPVRPFWIAAPLALFGVAFTFWRFMGDRDDG